MSHSEQPVEELRPSFSRRHSRLSSSSSLASLKTDIDWNSDIVVEGPEEPSPSADLIHPAEPNTLHQAQGSIRITPRTNASASASSASSSSSASSPDSGSSLFMNNDSLPTRSPCFVHSHLDKGASLQDWLHTKEHNVLGTDVGVARSLQPHQRPQPASDAPPVEIPTSDGHSDILNGNEGEELYGGSLTKQLAETAVGVREMSKQLGRARIRTQINSVLIVTKARDNRLIKLTRELALYLMLKPRQGQRGTIVYVDHQLRNSRRFNAAGIERDHPELFAPIPRRPSSSSNSLSSMSSSSTLSFDEYVTKEEGQLRYWTSDMCSKSPNLFDFVVTLGGDGTVLFTSWLFQRIVPPVLPFALGSLGFLTNFDFADYTAVVDSAIDSGIRVNLRMRFTCTVYRAVFEKDKCRKAVKKAETGEIMMKNMEKSGWEALEGGWSGGISLPDGKCAKDKEIMCFTTRPVETFEVLNDLVVDRGPSPYVSLLELFGDEHHMTTVQADGLCVSTPTGSTAYSLSAGGSLVHPEIPAILISPICPHTLSFRPMLLPDSMELRICVPYNSRSTAWVSFDGRGRVELKQGDHIKITASKYPFPTVCADKQSTDWFHAISRTLKWNERERQKSFVVVEEGPLQRKKSGKKLKDGAKPPMNGENVNEEDLDDELGELDEEDEDDEDEDEKFDIDDSSPPDANAELRVPNEQTAHDITVGVEKAQEQDMQPRGDTLTSREMAALAIGQSLNAKGKRRSKSRSRSRKRSGLTSGVDTPGRFAGPAHHPPAIDPRRVTFAAQSSPTLSCSSDDSLCDMGRNQLGTRDDLHSRDQYFSRRNRIPQDRDLFSESVATPRAADSSGRRSHHRVSSKDYDQQQHRAFAVWGNDESDSAASDTDP
ncbi:ATP-NAD kinase [Coniophora puteana RWD-64-598 SS2]|uniref:ATP-NAD kinase n=1 Tax=Coniophora puteana (strain RWD-64-598) TaxID=741705 RepID=A0A5M3MVZ9_CONPW|nr:ATP-NAD kinase [Coniophora puteana RWD-64-598 SS2]EIW82885.1 ATP-NAD kinase [Coniophora puteana RWD-64-598 SS2]